MIASSASDRDRETTAVALCERGATAAHGLVALHGFSASVGVGGYTLQITGGTMVYGPVRGSDEGATEPPNDTCKPPCRTVSPRA